MAGNIESRDARQQPQDQTSLPPGDEVEYVTSKIKSLDPGLKFLPYDHELILRYLMPKVMGGPFPLGYIVDVELYGFNPQTLTAMYDEWGSDGTWYFFTRRSRKYQKGSRPSRSVPGGYWKATGADKAVTHEGEKIGLKKALVFYEGNHKLPRKTNWIMQEYTLLSDSNKTTDHDHLDTLENHTNGVKGDDWVLSKIYENRRFKHKRQREDEEPLPVVMDQQDQGVVDQSDRTFAVNLQGAPVSGSECHGNIARPEPVDSSSIRIGFTGEQVSIVNHHEGQYPTVQNILSVLETHQPYDNAHLNVITSYTGYLDKTQLLPYGNQGPCFANPSQSPGMSMQLPKIHGNTARPGSVVAGNMQIGYASEQVGIFNNHREQCANVHTIVADPATQLNNGSMSLNGIRSYIDESELLPHGNLSPSPVDQPQASRTTIQVPEIPPPVVQTPTGNSGLPPPSWMEPVDSGIGWEWAYPDQTLWTLDDMVRISSSYDPQKGPGDTFTRSSTDRKDKE